jgi:hypothetical protein
MNRIFQDWLKGRWQTILNILKNPVHPVYFILRMRLGFKDIAF